MLGRRDTRLNFNFVFPYIDLTIEWGIVLVRSFIKRPWGQRRFHIHVSGSIILAINHRWRLIVRRSEWAWNVLRHAYEQVPDLYEVGLLYLISPKTCVFLLLVMLSLTSDKQYLCLNIYSVSWHNVFSKLYKFIIIQYTKYYQIIYAVGHYPPWLSEVPK